MSYKHFSTGCKSPVLKGFSSFGERLAAGVVSQLRATTILLLALALVTSNAQAATNTWDGGGANDNWDTILNWNNNLLPAITSDVVFGSGFASGTTIDTITDRTVNSITFSTTTNLTVGNASDTITLTSGNLTRTITSSGNHTILSDVTLSVTGNWDIGGTGTLTVSGGVFDSGTSSLTKNGSGTLILSGVNSYDGGTIMNAGLLVISGNLSSFDGNTTVNGGTLRATTSANALGDGSSGNPNNVILTGGTLQLANNTGLAFNRNTTVSGNTTITSDRLANGAGVTHTLGTLSIDAQTLNVNAGSLVTNGTAGVTFGATTLSANGAVFDVAIGARLTLASVAPSAAAQRNFTVQGAGDTVISGAITTSSGASTLTKNGTGTLTLSGATANTFTGPTTVSDGRLELSKTATVNAFGGSLVIGDGIGALSSAELRLINAGQIPNASAVAVLSDGLFALNGQAETIGTLSMTAGSVTTGVGALTLGGDVTGVANAASATISGNLNLNGAAPRTFTIADGAATEDMVISAIISNGALTKAGNGTLNLKGANTYAGGTTINGGRLLVNNATGSGTGSGSVVVNSGGTLGGTGIISGTITMNSGGTISAGNSPGQLTTGGQTWNSGATNLFEINQAGGTEGANPGWDLLNINGGLTIGATAGNKFVIDIRSLTLADTAGLVSDFNSNLNYDWRIAKTTAGITGFDATVFELRLAGFSNDLGGGTVSLEIANFDKDLILRFTAVPEASTHLLIGLGLLILGCTWRRHRV